MHSPESHLPPFSLHDSEQLLSLHVLPSHPIWHRHVASSPQSPFSQSGQTGCEQSTPP